MIGFCSWREGLVLRPELAGQIASVADVAAAGCGWSTGSRAPKRAGYSTGSWPSTASTSARLTGYETRATGHLEVAAAIAAGLADAGIASEPAALAYDLAFVPLTAERFDLVVPAAHAGSREVQACCGRCRRPGCSISSQACPDTP